MTRQFLVFVIFIITDQLLSYINVVYPYEGMVLFAQFAAIVCCVIVSHAFTICVNMFAGKNDHLEIHVYRFQ